MIGEPDLEFPLVESAVASCDHSNFTVSLEDGSTIPDIFTYYIDKSVKQVLISLKVTSSDQIPEFDGQ